MSNADIFNLLKGLKTEMILYMMVCTSSKTAKKRISHYHTQLRNVAITVSGKDLLKMGLKPGPVFSKILAGRAGSQAQRRVKTREDELGFVKKTFSESGVTAASVPTRRSAETAILPYGNINRSPPCNRRHPRRWYQKPMIDSHLPLSAFFS
jgi:hypothetical protein